jgi:PAS domain S-box-containing protein
MYGYTEAEALGMNIRDTVPEDRREQALDLLRQAETGQVVESIETQRCTKAGRILDVWLTTTKLLDEQGKIVAIATTERDITQRKQHESNLRRLASVVADSNDAITIQNLEGKITAWNKGAERMYGYTEREALLMNNSQLVPAAERARAIDLVRQIRTGEPVDSVELQRVSKEGRTLDVWLTITKLLDDQQKIVGFATTERDITQRKQDEASRGRLASVVADSNDAITIQDLDGTITAWNKGAQAMYGYTEEEALLMNIRDTVPEDRREQALDLLRQAETGRLVASLETQRRTKDGRTLDVWLTTTKLLDEQGKIIAVATTERDVTALRVAEKERREAHDRSQELARLQENNRFKTQFINTAAHELWTPLMPLRTQVHLLLNSPVNPPTPSQKKALGVMERNLERLGNLVEDLLTAARSQAGRQGVEPVPIDIGKVLVEAAEAYEGMAKSRRMDLTVPRDVSMPVFADPKRISQVLANLLSNAFKFTPDGGHVSLALRDEGADVRLSVTDSGMGIAKPDLARLFSPFVQVHDTSQVTAAGSGLGLFICKEFIELHGGAIGVDSRGKGEGSTFWFTLPKTAVQPALDSEPGAVAGAWAPDPAPKGHDAIPPTNSSRP